VSKHVEIVRRAYEAWNSGDFAQAMIDLDDQVIWQIPDNIVEQGSYQGHSELLAASEDFRSLFEDLSAEVERLIDAGEDRVVAVIRFQGRGATSGAPVQGSSLDAHVWTFEGDKVVHVRMHNGTDVLDELGIAGRPADDA
jgi:ketosteroid isomerase-like protein